MCYIGVAAVTTAIFTFIATVVTDCATLDQYAS